jgi:hypothetical protein
MNQNSFSVILEEEGLPDEGSMRFFGVLAVWILRFAQDDGKGRRTKFFLTQPKTRIPS